MVHAQEEARSLRHPHIGGEHLLLGLVRVDPRLIGLPVESVRSVVVEVCGTGEYPPPGGMIPFTPRAKKALELGLRNALRLGHDQIGPAHLLLGLLDVEDVARTIVARLGLEVDPIRERAVAMAGSGGRAPRDPAETLRAGEPLPVTLGEGDLPLGDLGHPRVDARLLLLMLVADRRIGRWLRERGIDEAAIRAEVPDVDEPRAG